MPHIHEKIDFTVEVFIVHDNKVLLRKHDKHNIWLSVGGHIELGEDPVEAAHREVKEETGLSITLLGNDKNFNEETPGFSELLSPHYMCRMKVNETHEHVTFVYFAISQTNNVEPEYESDKSNEWNWFSKEEIEEKKDLLTNIRFYALEALKTASLNP